MGLGGCYSCIKYLMFAFNFLFWLIGCALLGLGIWIRVDPNFEKYVNSQDQFNMLYTAAYILIAVGIIIMVIGFLGCCGAIRENTCMLGGFFVCLFIIFAVLLGFGIWAVVSKDTLRANIEDTLVSWVNKYRDDPAARNVMDNIQRDFDCCGAKRGRRDYPSDLEPESCKKQFYEEPCADSFFKWVSDHMLIIAGVAIGIAIVLILGMVFSMVLCCAIKEVNA
ncbi:CD9 antigen-like [Liolophura sinensis]|uniref:CD9 antigen-like n=1 Tax=Liolophura sinensis TaxID=3198878 RepID=UPI003158A6C5